MVLLLEVTGPQAEKLGPAGRQEFGAEGGGIGRDAENRWVLPSRLVSGHHAVIRYVGSVFYIEDTSSNGVFINTPDNPVRKHQPYALKPGDYIFIKPYKIRASIASASSP